MPSSLNHDLRDFVEFAARRIADGEADISVEELVRQWREDSESCRAVADVRQGLADDAAGLAESAEAAFADIRQRLGIAS